MDDLNEMFLYSSVEDMAANRALDKPFYDPDSQGQDRRVARLLILLQQLNESGQGLEGLPEPELSEIVRSAILLCGFLDPTETRNAIAVVLDAIEMQDQFTRRKLAPGQRTGLCDA
jgi:hypothetical protein